MTGKVTYLSIDKLKQPVSVDLRRVILTKYSQLLRDGIVREPIVIEGDTRVVLRGFELLEALKLLSAEIVPVVQVDPSKVKVKPITLKDVLVAGVRGPKLTYGSFEVHVDEDIPSIEVGLSELDGWRKYYGGKLRVYNDTLELLYKDWPTPLVKLRSLSYGGRNVWAKLEGVNPYSNSVKDRIGWSMIMAAIEEREIGDVLYEATSTNTGIAITAIANMLGKKTKLFIPQTIQRVSDIFLKVLGADVVRMPISLTVEAIGDVDSKAKIEGATHLNQFENDSNFKVHLKYTARELDEQLMSIGLKPNYIIGGLGTSGHMSAISIYFKSKYGETVEIVGVQPAPNEIIPGIRRIETGMKWIHWAEFDRIVDVSLKEAVEGAITIARREGLLIGLSSGAVVSAFNKIAKDEGIYILIFPDTGYKYAEQFEKYLSNQL
ncbi:MAG: pyridoxal-phosphate dependent enzyme [archaeon GBS-70-058]|nr:pyridoxal-phosphate dependent enzyme [Candidatus Culexarchaeum nevadense]